MKLQFLIPQYDEDESTIKPLLDSIAIQQNINMDDIGAVIVNDGSNVSLSYEFLASYPFGIEYYRAEHKGVSATRNACLDHARSDYVMFCDADDMFYNACGLYIVFREIDNGGFDSLVSSFIEETRDSQGKPIYISHETDSTFVHGKIHKRSYLIQNGIRWNESLTIHEDSFFNCLCQKLSTNVKYCPTPFYLWKWWDNSVCRHDSKYILKTYNNMLDSNTELIREFLKRGRISDAQFYATSMIYDAYFTMNKQEWISQENVVFRDSTEKRFADYYKEFKDIFFSTDSTVRAQIVMTLKNRMYQEGLILEKTTFDDWIASIEKRYLSRTRKSKPKRSSAHG